MLLAPLVGIILNLLDSCEQNSCSNKNDVVSVFASADCCSALHCGFQYVLDQNWVYPLPSVPLIRNAICMLQEVLLVNLPSLQLIERQLWRLFFTKDCMCLVF